MATRVFFPASCAWLYVTVADSIQDPTAATLTVISMIAGMLACIFMGSSLVVAAANRGSRDIFYKWPTGKLRQKR
jgi:hypothetical protein